MKVELLECGTLRLIADSQMEAYALRQWEKQRAQGKVKFEILSEVPDYLPRVKKLTAMMEAEMDEFKLWSEHREEFLLWKKGCTDVSHKPEGV